MKKMLSFRQNANIIIKMVHVCSVFSFKSRMCL